MTGVVGSNLYLRGAISGGVFTADGTVVSTLADGYSYLRFGTCYSTTAIYELDNNLKALTVAGGRLTEIEGRKLDADTLDGLHAAGFVQVNSDIILPAGSFARTPVLQVTAATAPGSSVSGNALIYLDSADGDLKVRFPNGTVRVIAAD